MKDYGDAFTMIVILARGIPPEISQAHTEPISW